MYFILKKKNGKLGNARYNDSQEFGYIIDPQMYASYMFHSTYKTVPKISYLILIVPNLTLFNVHMYLGI